MTGGGREDGARAAGAGAKPRVQDGESGEVYEDFPEVADDPAAFLQRARAALAVPQHSFVFSLFPSILVCENIRKFLPFLYSHRQGPFFLFLRLQDLFLIFLYFSPFFSSKKTFACPLVRPVGLTGSYA